MSSVDLTATAPNPLRSPPPQQCSSGTRFLRALPALAMVGAMGAGLWTAIAKGLDTVEAGDLSPVALLSHERRKALSQTLTTTGYADGVARLEREATWLTLGDLGPQVRKGCPGWLFLADELRVHPRAQAHADARIETLARIGRALQQRGIRLVVAVVPDKSRIESGQLCGLQRAPELANRAAQFVAGVRAAGIDVVDLEPVLRTATEDVFLRTDTHWNEAGSRLAAAAVANAVRGTGIVLAAGAVPQLVAHPPSERQGDLVRLAGIERLPARWLPSTDMVPQSTLADAGVVNGGSSAAVAPASANDLFGDADLPQLAVVGTSFSRNAHFVPFLANALQAGVANFAKDGGDFAGAAEGYFNGAAFRQNPPRVVLWEMPERVIQMPLGAAEARWLPLATQFGATANAAPQVAPAPVAPAAAPVPGQRNH